MPSLSQLHVSYTSSRIKSREEGSKREEGEGRGVREGGEEGEGREGGRKERAPWAGSAV